MAKSKTLANQLADALAPAVEAFKAVEETPVEESVEELAERFEAEEAAKPKTYTITLQGPKNQSLDYGINGTYGKLPCGVEIVVSESVYNAVKAHVISERE